MKLVVSPLMVVACDAVLAECLDETHERAPALSIDGAGMGAGARARRARPLPQDGSAARRMTMMRQPPAGATAEAVTRWIGCILLLLVCLQANAQGTGGKKNAKAGALVAGSDPAATSLENYLDRVRQENKSAQTTPGAIWTDTGRLTRMSTDVRAMRPHDLISVVVSENLAASTDGTVKNSRASSASSGISGLIGTLHAGNALQNLVNQNSSAGLNAQGASATNSSLTTTFGGQVVEVLPNGMLVIEAARQVEFSQQTQTIVLRGLVRPEDISQQNQVLSTAISSMELQVRGKGIVNDYTHRQNALVRLLEKVLVF